MSDFLKTIESIHPENRVRWKEYFMGIALLSRSRSPCKRLQVGCVIVKNNKIVSVGYNGFLPGAPHTSRVVNNHEQGTVHAEQNAVADAASRGASIEGGTALHLIDGCPFKNVSFNKNKNSYNVYYEKNKIIQKPYSMLQL